jgi:hypothetical protein
MNRPQKTAVVMHIASEHGGHLHRNIIIAP